MKKLALASAAAFALLSSGTANAGVKDRPTFKVDGLVIVWGSNGSRQNMVQDFYLLDSAGAEGTDLIGGGTDIEGMNTAVITGSFDPITGTGATDGSDDASEGFTDAGTAGVLDAADSFAAFELNASTDVDPTGGSQTGRFHVASNTAFDIMANAVNNTAAADKGDFDLDNINWAMSLVLQGNASNGSIAFGGNSQDPSVGGSGVTASTDLSAFAATVSATDPTLVPFKVFDGGQRTASNRGSITAQSVQFNNVYTFDADPATAGVQGYDLSLGTGAVEAEVTYTVYAP